MKELRTELSLSLVEFEDLRDRNTQNETLLRGTSYSGAVQITDGVFSEESRRKDALIYCLQRMLDDLIAQRDEIAEGLLPR